MFFFNNVAESMEDDLKKIDSLGDTGSYNHYPWGWAWVGDGGFRDQVCPAFPECGRVIA